MMCPHPRALAFGAVPPEQFREVRALLQSAALPTYDLSAARVPDFIVARDGERIIGAVALERYRDTALLRSLVVDAQYRGDGLGSALVAAAEQRARDLGIEQMILLTQTAEKFFAARGYRTIDRSTAPAAMQASPQFESLCPSSATCMRKDLV